ncbi:MAG: NADH-quinone oxidoreductase subunit C [Brevinematales bacterium]|nr:NADH-quinone oxidoreductase subunit C [Brevinematales bacterium]
MNAKIEVREIRLSLLIEETLIMKDAGYRLVQIGCTSLAAGSVEHANTLELFYSYDKNYDLVNLKVLIGKNAEIPSISGIYPAAYLYENEIHDLFGVFIKGMSLDFKGNLYKTAIPCPLNPDFQQKMRYIIAGFERE